jgi:superfamily II DNA or RNA helicase
MSRRDNRTTEEFLLELKESGYWNDDYDYSLVEFKNTRTNIIIIDKKFETKHSINPRNLLKGSVCSSKNIIGGYYSYDECKKYVHQLNLSSEMDWNEIRKNKLIPHYIPGDPTKIFKSTGEWKGMGDWLGTGRVANQLKRYYPFEVSREKVRKLKINSVKEWKKLVRKKSIDSNIPSNPNLVYITEWLSWNDWFGNKKISSIEKNKLYQSYDFCVKYLKDKNLSSWNEYYEFVKSNKIDFLPLNPQNTFKKFKNINEYLNIPLVEYFTYEEAIIEIKKVNVSSQNHYNKIKSEGKISKKFPTNPHRFYKNEWISWGVFLGTNRIANQNKEFYSFKKLKSIIQKENLKSFKDWNKYINKNNDSKIPSSPQTIYDEWISWGDFLGYIGDGSHQWTKSYILDFIKNIKDELIKLDSIELITIINSNNLAKKIKDLGFLEDLVSSKSNSVQRENVVSKIQKHISDLVDDSEEEEFVEEEIVENVFEEELKEGDDTFYESIEEVEELKDFKPLEELKFYDNKLITSSLDDENIDFLLKNQLKKLWNSVLNNEISIDDIINEDGGKNFKSIKENFLNEYQSVSKIKPPQDYIFKYQPNLMQRLVTYRMKNEKLYGNWSGTGAGKTLSSIFCGRYIGLKNTIIICNNSTISGWVNSIHEYFSNSEVYTKTQLNHSDVKPSKYNVINKYDITLSQNRFNYLVLNYETFQLEDGEFIVSELLKNNSIDYIILDEVQNVKQRSEKEESSRRNVVNKLIIHSKNENPNLHLMVMSATPVINNLVEPKKLIELISGEVHDELETKSSISNGIEMYKSLTRYGIRYKPKYGISVNEKLIQSNGDDLMDELKKVPKGSPIGFEKVLIQKKLESVSKFIKKGTLIYTHYVTDLVNEIAEFVSNEGFTYGFYIGEDKEGLRRFKNQEIDVLIGSSPIGTGVDGIQYVCDTLIPLILPWTSSEYEQLLGRINRQGSKFEKVNVYIPQIVVLLGEKEWSWDKRRYNIIKYKSTLADLSMDGIIPKELLPPKSTLVQQAQTEIEEWINRISENDILTIDREEIKIPLNPKQIEYKRKELGDFSELNKKWSVSNSKTIQERLKKDKSEWEYYHTLYREKRKEWNEIPYVEISKKLKGREDWLIADLGCGENLLSKEINNKVLSFDYVGIDNSVTECDISNLPLKDNEVDVSVFSLSLMGSNYIDYLKEGYRILKPYGNMFIVEPKKKWENNSDKLISQLESIGMKVVESYISSRFLYIQCLKIK